MSHPLEQKIAALRRRTRRAATIYGLSAAAAAVLGVVTVLGLADYCLRFQDRGLRIIASLLALGSLGWAVYRYRSLARKTRLRDIDLALRVERRFPGLEDRLLSSVEFLRQSEDDPVAGSAALRRAVITQTTAESERLDFSQVLDLRPPARAAALLAAVCLAAGMLVVLAPLASRTAVARLINPLGDTRWPQETHLAIRRPVERVARGQAFEVEVIDARGVRLPPDVRIHYRYEGPDGKVMEESERMQYADAAMAARRENVLRPFSYRVTGGDDRSMPWMDVDVVDPPAVESLDIRLIPPAYTGWPAEKSGKHIRAIVGTRIEMTGKATRPLESASLRLEDGKQIHAQVSDDGCEFTLSPTLIVEKSGAYWFDLVDREGLHGGSDDRWDIRAVADAPPTVAIDQPTSNLFVAPQAVVPLRVSAKDDLALRRIDLVFARSQPTGEKSKEKPEEKSLPLYAGPDKPPLRSASGGASGDGAMAEGERHVVEHRWELGPLKLMPGVQLNFWATAGDYLPQTGKSEPRQLIVVTPQELQDRIAGRQQMILAELQRALKMQRSSRAQVEALQIRSAEVGRIEQADVDRCQAAQLSQREVSQLLTSRGEGLPMHVFALLAELENNRIQSGDAQRWMRNLLAEIEQLDREHLTVIGRELTAAAKTAQIELQEKARPPQDKTAVTASLVAAGKHQDEAIAALERMLGQLSRWDNYRRFHREISQLLRDQEELSRRTAEVGRRTLTQELRDLAPQDSADLKIVSSRQLELARQLDRILQEMDQAGGELRNSDPSAAETVADALDEARRLAIGGQMRTAAAQIEQNQIGQSMAGQKQIGQDLQEVLDILGNRRQHELARLVKKLRDAADDLAAIEQKQAGLRKRLDEGVKEAGESARRAIIGKAGDEQKAIQQEAESLARRLERLQAEATKLALLRAAALMGEAGRNADRNDGDAARRRAADAEKALTETRRQLAEALRQAAVELAMEQLARLEDNLKHLHGQQQNAIDETKRLHALEQSQGELTRAQALSLRDLVRLERSLQTDAARLGEQLAGAGAFEMALTGAAGDMGRAAALLDRRETGDGAQRAEHDALRRLDMLLEALKPEEPTAESDGGGGQGNQQGPPPGAGIQSLAELKLLKLLQHEVNLRTETLQQAVAPDGKPNEQQRRQFQSLADQQGRLADLLLQLLRPVQQKPEDEPAGEPIIPKHFLRSFPKGGARLAAAGTDDARLAAADHRFAAVPAAARDPGPTYRRPLNETAAVQVPIDDELRRELGGAAQSESDKDANPLLSITRQMRDVQARINQADGGKRTQKLQQQIVGELERLIQQARKAAKACKPGTSQPQGISPRTPIGQPPKPGTGGQNPSNKPATGSAPRPPDGGQIRKPNLEDVRSMMKQLWGELPGQARQQMLQSPVEELPPKYEVLIEDYFHRLSEQKPGER